MSESFPKSARRQVTVAHAHTKTHNYLFVDASTSAIRGSVHFLIRDMARVMDINEQAHDPTVWIEANLDRIKKHVADSFDISGDGSKLSLEFPEWRLLPHGDDPFVVIDYRVAEDVQRLGGSFEVRFNPALETDPEREGLVVIQRSPGWGPLKANRDQHLHADKNTSTHQVSIEEYTWSQNLFASISELIRRILKALRRAAGRVYRSLGGTRPS